MAYVLFFIDFIDYGSPFKFGDQGIHQIHHLAYELRRHCGLDPLVMCEACEVSSSFIATSSSANNAAASLSSAT